MIYKGFIDYKEHKIPFVIEKFKMSLFSNEPILSDFIKEHNFKSNYILKGECFRVGMTATAITMLVDHSMGNECYLSCYVMSNFQEKLDYNAINFQATMLDNVFQYKYKFIELSRKGENLSNSQKEIWNIPFVLNNFEYNLLYKIGQNVKLGLLEDFTRHGELTIETKESKIEELFDILTLIKRFLIFLTNHSKITFDKIYLTKDNLKVAYVYYPLIDNNEYDNDMLYQDFNISTYGTKILNNLALELDNNIINSIPLGHIKNSDTYYLPQRLTQQVMSFEYLYEKLNPDSDKCLKDKLKECFAEFPYTIMFDKDKNDLETLATNIKKLRVDITHGYKYFYDFDFNDKTRLYFSHLDRLIECLSLKYLNFTAEEIQNFRKPYFI